MGEEQQLERSVLEGKERDELHAIAQAMALNPTPRARKSTLVDQILRASGVEVATPTRTRRKTSQSAGTLPLDESPETSAAPAPANPSETTGGSMGQPGHAEGSEASNGSAASSGRASPRRRRSGSEQAGGSAGGEEKEASRAEDASRGDGGQPGSAPDRSTSRGTEQADGSNGRAAGGAERNGAGGGGAQSGAPSNSAPTEGVRETSQSGEDAGFGGGGSQPGRGGRPAHFDVEPGNRRGRRRRGRDRDRGGDRELQGGASETAYQGEPIEVSGLLDLRDEGFGFLRAHGYLPSPQDVYVPVSQVRRFGLRKGDWIEGSGRPAAASERYPALVRVDTVGGKPAEAARGRPRFEDLTPLFPDTRLKLEVPGDQANMTARIVDLISPIGKGQRGLIVSPPKAGKTTIMKQIAHSIEANNPEVHLMVLLVDERPEEVTDMRRSVKGEVVASTFDRPAEEHTQVAELAIERARRLVEGGQDVVIILDGVTRLARAYNLAQPATGRIMSGGVDSGALYPPKKFFGAARNIEEGGSLTILATALVETGSRMDEVIFEEFKGTGNMELRLDRRLAERRVYPAIDVNASSTRHEELLFDRTHLQQVWKLRRVLNALQSEGSGAAGLELLMDKIRTTRTNDEFLAEVAKGPGV